MARTTRRQIIPLVPFSRPRNPMIANAVQKMRPDNAWQQQSNGINAVACDTHYSCMLPWQSVLLCNIGAVHMHVNYMPGMRAPSIP